MEVGEQVRKRGQLIKMLHQASDHGGRLALSPTGCLNYPPGGSWAQLGQSLVEGRWVGSALQARGACLVQLRADSAGESPQDWTEATGSRAPRALACDPGLSTSSAPGPSQPLMSLCYSLHLDGEPRGREFLSALFKLHPVPSTVPAALWELRKSLLSD